MPTQLMRSQITHTPQVTRALERARERWSGESDGKLLVHLIEAGGQHLQEERSRERDERLADLERMSSRYKGVFTESLASIREGWPE